MRSVWLTIAGWFIQAEAEIGGWLTIQSEMKEFGVLRQTINRALKAAGISLGDADESRIKSIRTLFEELDVVWASFHHMD